jgi:hypothetical protein
VPRRLSQVLPVAAGAKADVERLPLDVPGRLRPVVRGVEAVKVGYLEEFVEWTELADDVPCTVEHECRGCDPEGEVACGRTDSTQRTT